MRARAHGRACVRVRACLHACTCVCFRASVSVLAFEGERARACVSLAPSLRCSLYPVRSPPTPSPLHLLSSLLPPLVLILCPSLPARLPLPLPLLPNLSLSLSLSLSLHLPPLLPFLCACVRACVRARVPNCVRACVRERTTLACVPMRAWLHARSRLFLHHHHASLLIQQ
jgi:hypothetical protein